MRLRSNLSWILMSSSLILSGCKHGLMSGDRGPTITSTFDSQSGAQHPATASISGPTSLRCVSVSVPDGTCFVTAPGYTGLLIPGGSAESKGPGTVSLNCSGAGSRIECTLELAPLRTE
jgi:hypothetical protein